MLVMMQHLLVASFQAFPYSIHSKNLVCALRWERKKKLNRNNYLCNFIICITVHKFLYCIWLYVLFFDLSQSQCTSWTVYKKRKIIHHLYHRSWWDVKLPITGVQLVALHGTTPRIPPCAWDTFPKASWTLLKTSCSLWDPREDMTRLCDFSLWHKAEAGNAKSSWNASVWGYWTLQPSCSQCEIWVNKRDQWCTSGSRRSRICWAWFLLSPAWIPHSVTAQLRLQLFPPLSESSMYPTSHFYYICRDFTAFWSLFSVAKIAQQLCANTDTFYSYKLLVPLGMYLQILLVWRSWKSSAKGCKGVKNTRRL